ncbi:MAG: hypothetical protein IKK09_00920 [Clostridia bacterium]|nr:hypothetical protein [Clostridia bacterium]
MKKRVAFRSFVILLAAVMLLSSTSAYNILVYANQDSVANSLSAIGSLSEDAVTEPNIAVQGGNLELNADEGSADPSTVVWLGEGSLEDPYQISSAAHLMQVNKMVNATEVNAETGIHIVTDKHFILTADIDLTPLFANGGVPYISSAGSAYLVSADPSDPSSSMKYINLDGSYEVDGVTYKHKIYVDESVTVDVKNYENFALFGYLSNKSVISNVIFENIDVNVTALQPQRISVIAYRNDGTITDCEIINSSVTLPSKSETDGAGTSDAYYGIAGAVADNRAAVRNVNVKNFTLSLSSTSSNDYIGGLVGQNRGTVETSSVSGLKITVSGINHYVGGLVGYNTETVTGCAVDMAGDNNTTNNMYGGGYVGGLVGYNESGAVISNSSVTGSVTSAQTATTGRYNMYGTAENANSSVAYFGGITGVNKGTVEKTTVSDLGFFMGFNSVSYIGCFGGIAAVSTGGVINTSVASGSFVAQNSTVCRAGGIIGFAQTDDTKIVNDCYALFSLNVPAVDLVGAIVGYGGNAQTAYNSYWSDAISGCITSYVIPDQTDANRPYAIEASLGKLISYNRALVIERGLTVDIPASQLNHSFVRISGASLDVASISVGSALSVTGSGTNNSVFTKAYSATISFPSNAGSVPLVGSDDKQGMSIEFNLDVAVTSAAGDPDSQNNPMVISSSAMAKFIYRMPYGHFAIGADTVTVMSDAWNAVHFTGTIDGNDNMLSTEVPLFLSVAGSRDKSPLVTDFVSYPEQDGADRSRGCITNLQVDLSANIQSAVFGTVYNATFIDVSLTDGDLMPDDGNASSYEGYIAQLDKEYTAAFINCAIGYTYIYGCSTDVSVTMADVKNVAGFIAYVGNYVVIDNCEVSSVGAYIQQSSKNRAVFLGHVSDNGDGYILNSIVAARVIGSGVCYIVMGENKGEFFRNYYNLTWSKMEYGSNNTDSNMSSSAIKLWGSNEKSYSDNVKNVTASSKSVYSIALPQYVDAFKDATIDNFSVSFVNIDSNNAESAADTEKFSIENYEIADNELKISVSVSASANEGDNIWIKVYHFETGFLTYVKYNVIVEKFECGEDGYYHISSAQDLITFSELCAEEPVYRSYAYKLDNDIYMSDLTEYTFTPIGTSAQPFTGYFDGMGDDGTVHTIKDLKISGSGNVAMFAFVSMDSKAIVDPNKTHQLIDSGIHNLRIEYANVTATGESANAAVLVGVAKTSSGSYGKVTIKNIEIVDSSVNSQGKNTAAVLADSINTDIDISGIVLTRVKVETSYSTGSQFFNNSEVSAIGGLGGIVGTIDDTVEKQSVSHQVSITDVTVDGLSLTGDVEGEDTYAPVNAGAVVGTYQKYFTWKGYSVPRLTVGDASSTDEYDIVINNLKIMSAGMAGGLIGSTNAQTTVNKAKISATEGNKSQILSTTQYFIGGIAGYIGSYNADNETNEFAVANVFGTVKDCLVENTEIKAEDKAIEDPNTTLTRNVAVGGIVGAINGPASGETVKNCIVKNSLVEGVVVGGIVGSNIERTVDAGNTLHITKCDVIATTVKTLDSCYPAAYSNSNVLVSNRYAGVGGILGTNVTSTKSYVIDLVIDFCNVDEASKILNTIPAKNNTTNFQAATGGILGYGFQLKGTAIQLSLANNTVYASIESKKADMAITALSSTQSGQQQVRVGTGGFIGMLSGFGAALTTATYLMTTSVKESVFGGSIVGTDCIGGAIGSIVLACGWESTNATATNNRPTDLLKDIVISGQLRSELNNTFYRGGVAIGNILVAYATPAIGTTSIGCYNGKDMTQTFSGIYFSSLTIDTSVFPVFSCVGAKSTTAAANTPFLANTKKKLIECYIDVNTQSDNATYQIAAPDNTFESTSTEFTVGSSADSTYAAPVVSRGDLFSFENTAMPSYWKSSNSSIVAVSDTAPYNNVLVTPKRENPNPITISIDYQGTLTSSSDSSWSVPVRLPVGFKIYSTASKGLDFVDTDSGRYYLITEPLDFYEIKSGESYWLKNDIVFDAESFEANHDFDGGYSNSNVFTGEFASPPKGTYKINGNSDNTFYADGNPKTITGIKFKPVTVGSYTASALFAQADGATFKNFNLVDVSSTGSADYAASVAAVINGSLTAENVTVENVNISGAKYSGGLFGGMFNAADVAVPWSIKNCKVLGTRTGDASGYTYSSNISGLNGAAGIAVHTDQNAASFTDLLVSGCSVSQRAENMDSTYFDNGAAGISLAFSGEISSTSAQNRNTVENSYIVGEIAAGAVMRTYTSSAGGTFTSAGIHAQVYSTVPLSISGVDIKSTTIEGNHTFVPETVSNQLIASGGILARVDSSYVKHNISDCTLDENTTVMAPYGVGGILGCFEETVQGEYDNRVFGITITNCGIEATIKMTIGKTIKGTSNTYQYYNMGAGGVIGAFSSFSNLTETNVVNCEVTGVISGPSAVGGIIGAIWTNYANNAPSTFRLDNMDSHFVENCIVSAEFKNAEGEDSFVASTPATGIIVGHILNASLSDSTLFRAAADSGFESDFSNQPFYNIYYSGHKYPQHGTYLFGIANMSAATKTSLNYCANGTDNVYSCYTDYAYDMDYVYSRRVSADKSVVISTGIDPTYHNVIFSDIYRVQQTESEEDGIWVVDSRTLGSGLNFSLSDFTFNTAPVVGAEAEVTYRFNDGASLSAFTLSASVGSSQKSVANLEKVTATSSAVKVEEGSANGEYILSAVNALTKTLVFDLVFVYSNGLELVAPFRIEVSDGDYYYADNGDGSKNYYIFNAANLNSTMQLTLGEHDNVVQCFDVFWTLDNADIKNAVNTYTNDTTLAQAFAGVTFGGTDIITLLDSVKHPNPEYDSSLPTSASNPVDLTIRQYLGLANDASLGEVTLRRLVKEINLVSYGTYGDEGDSTLYEKDFAGNYTVLKSVTADKTTGLTNVGEYYSVYGLELHAVNVNAQKADSTHTGLFKSLVSGASVTGLTFVNPRIEVVGAKADENYAGVLAGTASGATITDVSVERYADGDSAYISSIRWMTAASTNVGGIVGKADAATTITNATVNGLDVVGASLAGSNTKDLTTVMAGGIAGASDATISNSSVSNSRILIERNDRYRNYYLSYAGGIAARATGTISGAIVSDTVMRDCTCEVIVQDEEHSKPYSTYSCEDNALVADRIGGIAAFTEGLLTVTDAVVKGITVRAFDIAGGILAEVADNANAEVSVTDSSVVENSDIRVYSSANVASVSSLRQYFNAAGGAIGKIDNLKSLNIDSFNFDGYVGTYSYDNLNKDCTAGGIVGFVTDRLISLDTIKIYNSTVSGEVVGYRTTKTGNMIPYLGAAGGIIGKINTTEVKNTTDSMVSDCVMGAEVTLYNNVSGTAVNANLADPANSASTNVGKVLGTLVSKVTNEETNEDVSSNFALDAENISVYFDNIYISSYPQDIVAYGSQDFYVSQKFSPFTTYTDINKIIDAQTGESTGALAIGGLDLSGVTNPSYTDDEYSELAIIPIDTTNPSVVGKATRGFRVKHKSITFGNNNRIDFEGNASITAETDIGGATIEVTTKNVLADKNDGYYYGTLHIDQVTKDIIGEIVMDYSYGLQVNVQFIGMDIRGDGSSTSPFEVREPKHFAVVRVLRDKNYIQTADIDFASQYSYSEEVLSPLWATAEGFEPIGTANAPFIGSYDGQGKLITNLYISRANTDNVGLFGYVKGTAEKQASISNVHIELAGEMSLSLNDKNLGDVTVVQGNVTGKNNVGGLVGSAVNADITNCSVVKGNVIGSSAVGGLVGNASASKLVSDFTSTTAFAYCDLGTNTPGSKTAGGLVGSASGSLEIKNCFTLGYAALDPYNNYNYGAVGGFVGYAQEGTSLVIDNAFVGSGISDSYGNGSNVVYYGLTVGAASGNVQVRASNVFVSATSAAGESVLNGAVNSVVNPILGTTSGAATVENVRFDSGINGTLPNRKETAAQSADFDLSGIEIGVGADKDPYTAAYVDFASVEIKVSDVEKTDRLVAYTTADGAPSQYQLGGLFYPVTVIGSDLTVTSSEIDDADELDYPAEMDTDLYGNGDRKNTDFLFKDTENGTTVYTNIFVFSPLNGTYNKGTPHDNGELFYSNSLPYFTVEKTVGNHSLYRKVTYPIQSKYEDGGRLYPIATERQLNALADYETSGTFADFSKNVNYALIENITLGDYEFKPITGFTGVLNGKGHTVSNVTINRPESTAPVGFFSELTKGTVKNLNLEVNSVVGNNYVGGLVGYVGADGNSPSKVVISNCSVSSYTENSGVTGNEYVGGLVGYAVAGETADVNPATGLEEGKAGFFNSFTDVKVSGLNVVGGLVGGSEMYITNCYSTGDVNGAINATGDTPRGIGGLVGLLAAKSNAAAYPTQTDRSKYQALLNSSFSSSAVDVSSVTGYNTKGNGVGGLAGNVTQGTSIATVFSSGSVRFCYDDNVAHPDCENSPAIGVGGLVGVLNSETKEVYSAASVAAKVGNLTPASVVGIGGVIGVSNAHLQSAYSSGSTLGETSTTAQEIADNSYNYGVGGVIGLVSGNGLESSNLYFDHNASAVSDAPVGRVTAGVLKAPASIGSKSTKEFTQVPEADRVDGGFLGGNFQFTTGAYPYLSNFFADTVSLVIRFNALLSIVAVEIDERDKSAVDGDGISMAMTVPTGVPHDGVVYTYGFEADNSVGKSATSIVDTATNTLSVQRTSNTKEQANFIITISTVDGKPGDGNVVYSEVASRPFSRVTAEMLGTQDKPYLVASQTDLEHVAMSAEELGNATGLYAEWNTPIDSNGEPLSGKVHYRLMGYVNLNESDDNLYNRSFSTLDGGYLLDGNGYSIRKLSTTLANTLDANSSVTNVTFENVTFESGESLIGTLNGSVIGVNVFGKASGSNVAGIANTVGESGLVEGSISAVDYTNNGEDAAAQSNIAGLALTNKGTINMSASVGSISGKNLTNVSGLVGTNSGEIKNSFTMGDIILDNPAGVVAGFVGTNNGTVEAGYTRCNFKVKNVADALTIGSFAGSNISLSEEKIASIASSFAAGLFDVRKADASPIALNSIFVAQNSGTLEDVMFDKQLSGTCFKDIFAYAESTSDIITMSNHTALCSADGVYTRAKESNGEAFKNDEYPQLSVILNTANSEDEVTVRMYRALRSYSQLSAVTALVANDNYIDNVVAESTTPLTYGMMSWAVTGAATTSGAALKAKTWNEIKDLEDKSAIATATLAVEDFYNVGASAKLSDTLNLYFTIDDDGANPNFAGGNGSEGSKYQISAPEHVIALSYYGKNSSSYFEVTKDIDMSGANWNNSYINIFKANLDGNGKVIANVEIPVNGSNAFIGSLEGGSISNLGLTGIKVTTSTTGASGLLAAKALNNASVTNCVVVGELNAPTGSNVGGLFGETDGPTVIDGCIVSGKIESGATYVGGLVGNAADGTAITNCLSTAVVNGGANTTATGGILGSGTATVTNSVFAGNVKGNTVGNIAGESENVTVENSYYDKQLSTVDGGANASTTHYLTAGADVADFGGDMVWITGFVGYPVPAALASSGGGMLNAVKLASAKITFANGVGAGTSTTFTTATPTPLEGADLDVSGLAASESNRFLKVENGTWVTDTSSMALGQVYDGELTYKLGSMTRYVDVTVGKKVNTVNYKINGLASGNSIVSAITGNGGGATAATAFDTARQGVLCNDMVFTYDVVDGKAQLFRVETQLPNGYVQGKVTAKFNDTAETTVSVETDENGIAYIAVPTSIGVFDTIDITVEAVSVDTWGVRNLFGLFR